MSMRAAVRWSDHDWYIGPFTYARERDHRHLALVLRSAGDDYDEDGKCYLRLAAFGHTLIVALPSIIKPAREWVDTSKHEWSKSPSGGYWNVHPTEFGFSVFEGHLSVFYGQQTHDSSTEKRWGMFLPWTEWRHVRETLYDLAGKPFWTQGPTRKGEGAKKWEAKRAAQDRCPSAAFAFADYDGEHLTATTRMEESEMRLGQGWFKWLSLFRRPKISRGLNIRFSGETGREKGSWKGGTVGHSITTLPGELHEAAFRRYCAEHQMTFIG